MSVSVVIISFLLYRKILMNLWTIAKGNYVLYSRKKRWHDKLIVNSYSIVND